MALGTVFSAIGGFGIGWTIGDLIRERGINPRIFIGGLACTIISFPLYSNGTRRAISALERYNSSSNGYSVPNVKLEIAMVNGSVGFFYTF